MKKINLSLALALICNAAISNTMAAEDAEAPEKNAVVEQKVVNCGATIEL